MKRVLVCGGRRFDNAELLGSWLGGVQKRYGIACIIEGGATGADWLARRYAEWQKLPTVSFPVPKAEWSRLGRKAGPLRNQRMLDDGKPDIVVAFPGGAGTADMVRRARVAGIEVIEVAG